MANLKIRIDVDQGNTVSKFAVSKLQKVVFRNDHKQKSLTVSINGATDNDSPLCNEDGDPVPSFVVPKKSREDFFICGNWQQFKYTATIDGANAEDPIVIIESDPFIVPDQNPIVIIEKHGPFGGDALLTGVALVTALLAGAFLGRFLKRG